MKKFKLYQLNFIFLSFLLFSNCKVKDNIVSPIVKPNPFLVLDTLWTHTTNDYSCNPEMNSNMEVLMSQEFHQIEGEKFSLFDPLTGNIKWQWQDYFLPELGFSDNNHLAYRDVMVLCARNRTYAFNMLTGKTIWRHSMDSMIGEPQIFLGKNGYIYHGFGAANHTYKIFRTKYNEGKWELVSSYKDTMEYDRMYTTGIAISENEKGEDIMVNTLYLAYMKNSKYTVNSIICGYNLSSNKFEWIKDYTKNYAEFNDCKIQSLGGFVYGFATYGQVRHLYAINANDGSISWDRVIPDLGVSLHIYNNSIIPICIGFHPVTSFDVKTGNIIWNQDFVGQITEDINFEFGDAKVFKHYLISTECDYLLVLDLDNGSVVYNKSVSIDQGCLQNGVVVNEEKRLLYVQDRYKVVCYKLPDEIKN